MNKLLSALTAGAAALILTSGIAISADQSRPREEPPRASENQPGNQDTVKTNPEQARQDEDYMAALKKCDPLKGGEKQTCVEAARKKFGRM